MKNVHKRKKSKYQEREEDDKKEEKVDEIILRAETPRIYKHNRFIRPFETLINLYGTPSYSEVDPTPFVAITFPLIFGLMFGDIGHGIVLI
ncbi:MAG: V-type ATPase 116kDa subunit family protein, partial [Promethearchaeota archaeon]